MERPCPALLLPICAVEFPAPVRYRCCNMVEFPTLLSEPPHTINRTNRKSKLHPSISMTARSHPWPNARSTAMEAVQGTHVTLPRTGLAAHTCLGPRLKCNAPIGPTHDASLMQVGPIARFHGCRCPAGQGTGPRSHRWRKTYHPIHKRTLTAARWRESYRVIRKRTRGAARRRKLYRLIRKRTLRRGGEEAETGTEKDREAGGCVSFPSAPLASVNLRAQVGPIKRKRAGFAGFSWDCSQTK